MSSQIIPPPENINEYPYIGWIPCVSGHLDFCLTSVGLSGSFLGANKIDKRAKTINYSCEGLWDVHRKRILLKSWVDWQDAISGDGKSQVILIAECNRSENLDERSMSGRVIVFPWKYSRSQKKSYKKLIKKIDALDKVYSSFEALENEEQQFNEWPNVQSSLNQQWEDLHAQLYSNTPLESPLDNVYAVDFHVTHSGFVFLKFIETERESGEETEEPDQYVLTRQAYYYLKYSIHKHNHHVEEADCLTTIVKHSEENLPNVGLKLMGQLKRELVQIKRIQRKFQKRHGETEALGILGYMHSLLASCRRAEYIDDDRYFRELDYIAGMRESFSSQHDSIQVEASRKNVLKQLNRQKVAIYLAYFSICTLVYLRLFPPAAPTSTLELTRKTTDLNVFLLGMLSTPSKAIFSFILLFIVLMGYVEWDGFFNRLDKKNPRLIHRIASTSWWKLIGLFAVAILILSIANAVVF